MLKKSYLFYLIFLFTSTLTTAQNCDCKTNFNWVKKTFEENDAGFEFALKNKGNQAYSEHNKIFEEKVQKAKSIEECAPILYQWLNFFRYGHIAIRLNEATGIAKTSKSETQFVNWETINITTNEFKKYLDTLKSATFEGIWVTNPYTIGIKKIDGIYIGFILESGATTWTKGQVKLKINHNKQKTSAIFYMRDHSAVESNDVLMLGKNHLKIGNITLTRSYPKIEDEAVFVQYFKMLNTKKVYLEKLNQTTLYLRIPSFEIENKRSIDSVLQHNKNNILQTKNLIIDIRNNGGGSDASYSEIIPYLYTNPIRTVGVEFYSTKLNNKRMLDFINNPEYGFDEEGKQWARKSYNKLENNLGKFINLDEHHVSIDTKDTIYPYPQQIAIIINEANGSTAEQFLLEAKQSKKVKLFGTSTFGVLDISNMYFVDSPCNEFQLGYSLSKSLRIPEFSIDGKGIQPDYYLDNTIPNEEWTNYVIKTLNGE